MIQLAEAKAYTKKPRPGKGTNPFVMDLSRKRRREEEEDNIPLYTGKWILFLLKVFW